MKKCALLVLALLLLFSSATCAQAAEYSSTQTFIEWLEASDISYTYSGVDDNGFERLSIDNTSDVFSYTLEYIFESNGENSTIRVWDIILYNDSDLNDVLHTINDLNTTYGFVNVYALESDNSVNAKIDLIYRTHDVGEIVGEATLRMVAIVDDVYEAMSSYQK